MERQPRRRRRPALSCLECRRRKIKCDRNDPCRHCVSSETACNLKRYRDDPATRLADLTSSLHANARRPSPPAQDTSPSRTAGPGGQAFIARGAGPAENKGTGTTGNEDTRAASISHDTSSGLQNLLRRVWKLEQTSSSSPLRGITESGRGILASQFGLRESQIVLNKTRTLRSSHWMGTAQEFGVINACYMAVTGDNSVETSFQNEEVLPYVNQIADLLHKCKIMTRSLKADRPSRCTPGLQIDLNPPSREFADDMVRLYLKYFESTCRILHVPTFWAEYERFWDSPESAKTDLRLKILLAIGLGSSLSHHADTDPGFRNTVQQWLYAAQIWLAGPLEKDRLGLSGIQIHCLTLIARQVFTFGGDLAWMSIGSLVHQAMQIGLHRDPDHLPPMSSLQAETRRRLWATILEMAVQSSVDAAMPPRIALDEYDTQSPSNVNDEDISDSATAPKPFPRSTHTETSMQLILLDSLPTRLKILQLLNGLHSEISYEDVLSLSSKMNDTMRTCGQFMNEHKASGVTPFHRNLFDFLVRRFMIPLHCAFACKARINPLFQSSLKICIDTALALLYPEPDEGFSRLLAMGGGLFREGLRYACSVISLEFIAETKAQNDDGTLHRNSAHRNILKQATKDLISLAADRIRQGENNVKMHMFLSMIRAQVEAIEAGDSVEFNVARSGRDSLELCYRLLQERVSRVPLSSPNNETFLSSGVDGRQSSSDMDWDVGFFMPSAVFF